MKDIEIRSADNDSTKAVLSESQVGILQDMADGMTNKEIAAKRSIGVKTVEAHRYNIIKKTGAKRIIQVIVALYRKGVIV